MSMMPVEPILAFALIASSPMPVIRVDDATPISCLSSEETRHAAPGEVVRIRLCRQGEDFVYVVTTLKRDGRVARVTLEGQSGKIATIR